MKLVDWEIIFKEKSDKNENINILRSGPDYARYVLGFVQKCQIKQTLEEIANIMHFDMQVVKNKPESADKTKTLSSMALTLIKIDEKINTSASSIQEDMALFEKIRVTHLQADVKSIHETAYIGNYTSSGLDLKELTNKSTIVDVED